MDAQFSPPIALKDGSSISAFLQMGNCPSAICVLETSPALAMQTMPA
jgi:hypothetical protein